MKIADGLRRRPNWSGYSWADELEGAAITQMVAAAMKFDPDHAAANPFGYLSMTGNHAMIRANTLHKQQGEIAAELSGGLVGEVGASPARIKALARENLHRTSTCAYEALSGVTIGDATVPPTNPEDPFRPCPSFPGYSATRLNGGQVRKDAHLRRARGGGEYFVPAGLVAKVDPKLAYVYVSGVKWLVGAIVGDSEGVPPPPRRPYGSRERGPVIDTSGDDWRDWRDCYSVSRDGRVFKRPDGGKGRGLLLSAQNGRITLKRRRVTLDAIMAEVWPELSS